MSNIAIVVDSTAVLLEEEIKRHGNLYVIPLYFFFGEEFYEDGSFGQKEYFKMVDDYYKENKILPQTSQPSIGRCIEVFEDLLKTYDHVIYYTMSSKLSGTYQSGVTASKEFDGRVSVVDSLVTSELLKRLALKAAMDVKEGKDVIEIIAKSNELIRKSYAYFVVDNLGHLQRTGRISASAAVVGSMLKLKPILKLTDGEIVPVDKVRNITKAHKQAIDYIIKDGLEPDDFIGMVHADGYEYALNVKNFILKKYDLDDLFLGELSGVISTHTGPKTIAIFVIKGYYK